MDKNPEGMIHTPRFWQIFPRGMKRGAFALPSQKFSPSQNEKKKMAKIRSFQLTFLFFALSKITMTKKLVLPLPQFCSFQPIFSNFGTALHPPAPPLEVPLSLWLYHCPKPRGIRILDETRPQKRVRGYHFLTKS